MIEPKFLQEQVVDGDSYERVLGQVEIEKKDGTKETRTYKDYDCCNDAIPLVDPDTALMCLLFNIFLPGIGTMIAAYKST